MRNYYNIENIIYDEEQCGKKDINVVLNKNTIEEIIDSIFEQVYSIKDKYDKINKGQDVGFYIVLDKLSKDEYKKLHHIFRMHYNAIKIGNKIMLGDTNLCDWENTQSNCRLFILESLIDIFNSKRNNKLEDDLKINSVNDIKTILRDLNKSRKLSNYILEEVEMKFKTLVRQKSNPDYNVVNGKFEKINYLYLDKQVENDEGETEKFELEDFSLEENSYSSLSKYIIKEFFNLCTDIQKKFIGAFLMYEIAEDGSIFNFENDELYTKQQVNQFRKQIRKRLEKEIEDDIFIKTNEYGRWVLKD